MDRDVEQLMDGPMGRPVMSEATCSHVWDREALPVMLVRPGGYQLGQTYEAFPCQSCGALLVMNERDG